jgi:hypothetical protein
MIRRRVTGEIAAQPNKFAEAITITKPEITKKRSTPAAPIAKSGTWSPISVASTDW